jgi:hypothetical protein
VKLFFSFSPALSSCESNSPVSAASLRVSSAFNNSFALATSTGVFLHWLQISDRFNPLGSKWEKEQVEKRLGRKL